MSELINTDEEPTARQPLTKAELEQIDADEFLTVDDVLAYRQGGDDE